MKWFKHETDAHMNLKLQAIIEKFGLEALGYYWICIELVGGQSENFQIKPDKMWKSYLSRVTGLDTEKQDQYLEFFADLNLIDKKALKSAILSIPKLGERSDDYTKRVRRMSEHTTDNVPLEENRIDKNRTEQNREDNTPSQKAKEFFENPEPIIKTLIETGFNESITRREVNKFINYWIELTPSGKKQRWQTEKTFEIMRRLATWFSRVNEFKGQKMETKGIRI